ncbi:MAG: DUF4956 domain-containing protein [Mycetocola sp.]
MTAFIPLLVDLVAICVLTFGLYFPRHRRRDLVVAFLGVNVGVLALSQVLATATLGAGLGLGLFGVLSIIRLRSSEIAQHEVAYYFSSLALGLLAGLGSSLGLLSYALMAVIVAVVFVGDNPALFRHYRQSTITVDRAFAHEEELKRYLSGLLEADVSRVTVIQLDLVNDTTLVDVRYRVTGASRSGQGEAEAAHSQHGAGALSHEGMAEVSR